MPTNETTLPPKHRCSACGAELPAHLPLDLCPKCLLKAGLDTQPAPKPAATIVLAGPGARARGLPEPGEQFGHYRITGLLGEGGMGAVYEAEDLENGRRVALKVLSHTLDSPEARARFFREGRLAASINHPNSVYVFGTEEIGGTPVIAMELVAGGTLQNRVAGQGPMPVREAVDAILQIISGLEAAQRIGILHRDIKPSNCFVDSTGQVKIGDFGLSISTMVRTEPALTVTGAFLGTPAYSSPEQLRGDELTVRSDIYAVGVTLYYLLTGRMPFAAPSVVQLLATVLERPAESPDRFRREIPKRLSRVVLRCLEKDPGQRFKDYTELRNALWPYASVAPTPATVGLRFVAGCIDSLLLGLLQNPVFVFLLGGWGAMTQPDSYRHPRFALAIGLNLVLLMLYYALLEGLVGVSIGKAICRLRVVGPDRNLPGVWRAWGRAALFLLPPMLPGMVIGPLHPEWLAGNAGDWRGALFSLSSLCITALLFSSMRRANGFAGWHELFSATRVVLRSAYAVRPTLAIEEKPVPTTAAALQIGPYHVLEEQLAPDGTRFVVGFDGRLLRKVWIRCLRPGTAPVPPPLRNIGRPGRIRWLTGRRTETEAWDAYEALPGQPLLQLLARRQSWTQVRFWLLDLAEELHAASHDGSPPLVLSLDHVWITDDGRAKLLDFPAPGTWPVLPEQEAGLTSPASTATDFLRQVAWSTLQARVLGSAEARDTSLQVPVALHARDWLHSLQGTPILADLVGSLKPLLGRPPVVTPWRRLGLVIGGLLFPLLVMATVVFGLTVTRQMARSNPEISALRECLSHLGRLQHQVKAGDPDKAPLVEAFEVYVAGRFQPTITNTAVWHGLGVASSIPGPDRQLAERIIASRPTPSEPQFLEAKAAVQAHLKMTPDEAAADALKKLDLPKMALLVGYIVALVLVIAPCLISSLVFRGGALVHVLGLAVVKRNGSRAARWHVGWRSLLAWLPFLLLPFLVRPLLPMMGFAWAVLIPITLVGALTVVSVLLPERSLQDRLAGTCLVLR